MNKKTVTARRSKISMVVSHSDREICKLDLTASGNNCTKTAWLGKLGMDNLGSVWSGTTSAAKSVVGINLQKRG